MKKGLSFLLLLCLWTVFFPAAAFAAPAPEGKEGPWDISAVADSGAVVANLYQNSQDGDDPTYTLVISGTGQMRGWEDKDAGRGNGSSDLRPWAVYSAQISKVEIGEGVANIGENAFFDLACSEVSFPRSSLQALGRNAFRASALERVALPDSVTKMGSNVFADCTNLASIDFGKGLKEIGICMLDMGQGSTPNNKLESIVLPLQLETVQGGAFRACRALKSVKILSRDLVLTGNPNPLATGTGSALCAVDALACESLTIEGYSTQINANVVFYVDEMQCFQDRSDRSGGVKYAVAATHGGAWEEAMQFEAGKLAEPVKPGYQFAGWYADENFGGDPVTAPSAGETYHAKWDPNTYTIRFAGGDGAEGTMEEINAVCHQTTALPDSVFVKPGFDFMGWDTDVSADTVVYGDGAQVENLTTVQGAVITLYAVWKEQIPIIPDTALALDQAALSLEPGQTAKLKAALTPADATYKYIFWESSDEAIATVSDSGVVTAVADGTAAITAKSWYGNTAACEVTVKKADEPTPPEPVDPWPTEGLEGFVTRCYRVALSRDPDKAGHADWVRWLKDGTVDATTCTYGFVFSKEMNSKNLSDEAFVKTLYNLFMDREGEATGVAFWTEYLQAGHSREEVFHGFADSAEFARIKTNYGIQ